MPVKWQGFPDQHHHPKKRKTESLNVGQERDERGLVKGTREDSGSTESMRCHKSQVKSSRASECQSHVKKATSHPL